MHSVKFGAWNIHGLGKKLKEDDVHTFVNTLDFVALMETWTTVRSSINFSGYGNVHQIRKKGVGPTGVYFSCTNQSTGTTLKNNPAITKT